MGSVDQGSLFFPKNCFFLKPNIRDLSFFSKNANVAFIEKSEFFSLKKRLLQKPLVLGEICIFII